MNLLVPGSPCVGSLKSSTNGETAVRLSRMKRMLPALAMLLLLAMPAAAQDIEKGVDAYQRGDYAAALAEWHPLAEQGDAYAQFFLGVMYDNGEGVPQDDAEAARWYRPAAEQGVAEAQYNLGVMYRNGEGVPQDYAEAARYNRMAAEQDHAKAQHNLGVMYALGQGVPQDYGQSHTLFSLAAEQGHPAAHQYALGRMYHLGEGVPQDYVLAHMWLNLAAALGHTEAVEGRNHTAGKMTPGQIAEAQRMAREWMAKNGN